MQSVLPRSRSGPCSLLLSSQAYPAVLNLHLTKINPAVPIYSYLSKVNEYMSMGIEDPLEQSFLVPLDPEVTRTYLSSPPFIKVDGVANFRCLGNMRAFHNSRLHSPIHSQLATSGDVDRVDMPIEDATSADPQSAFFHPSPSIGVTKPITTTTKPGRVFRCTQLAHIRSAGIKTLEETLNVRAIFDFRSSYEIKAYDMSVCPTSASPPTSDSSSTSKPASSSSSVSTSSSSSTSGTTASSYLSPLSTTLSASSSSELSTPTSSVSPTTSSGQSVASSSATPLTPLTPVTPSLPPVSCLTNIPSMPTILPIPSSPTTATTTTITPPRTLPSPIPSARVYHVPVVDDSYFDESIDGEATKRANEYIQDPENSLLKEYKIFLERGARAFAEVFRFIALGEDAGACIVHCAIGKDRTGVFAAVLLMFVGVSDEDIAEEYALTRVGLEPVRNYILPLMSEPPAVIKAMLTSDRSTMLRTLDWIRTRYGGAEQYLLNECGLTPKECEDARKGFIM